MKIRYILTTISLLGIISCSCPGSEKSETLVSDSGENRYQQAAALAKAYPVSEWGEDIMHRISEETGPEVAQRFKERVLVKAGEMEMLETRLKILTDVFTAPEIEALNSLLATPAGKAAYRKLYLVDERLKKVIAPDLNAVLISDDQ